MDHTPGPWEVCGDNDTLIGAHDGKMMIAETLYKHVIPEWSRPLKTAQANAKLIAVSPKLLAALRKIAAGREDDWGYDHPERKMISFARSVIKNLEGD